MPITFEGRMAYPRLPMDFDEFRLLALLMMDAGGRAHNGGWQFEGDAEKAFYTVDPS